MIKRKTIAHNSPANGIFFLFHIIIGSLFVLQLIISVIIDNFSKEMHEGVSEEELRHRDLSHLMTIMWGKRAQVQPRPTSGITQICYDICVDCYPRKDCQLDLKPYLKGGFQRRKSSLVDDEANRTCCGGMCGGSDEDSSRLRPSKKGEHGVLQRRGLHVVHSNFEMVILLCIVINSSMTLTEHYEQSDRWTDILYAQNAAFVGIFSLEAIIKIIGLSPAFYFTDPWNLFDFLVVLGSWPTLLMDNSTGSSLRLIRILRLSRIVKRFDSLRAIVETFVISAKQILQVLAIVFSLDHLLCRPWLPDLRQNQER